MSETPYMRLAVDMADFPEGSEIEVEADENVLTAVRYSRGGTKEYYKVTTIGEGESDIRVRIYNEGTMLHSEIVTFQVNA